MAKLDPQTITLEKLKAGEYQDVFPQLDKLKTVVENSAWHDHQTVYDHTIKVLASLEQLFELSFIKDKKQQDKLEKYLQSSPYNLSYQTLIFLGTIFHDLAKEEVLIEASPGIFAAPGHELLATSYVNQYADKLDLTPEEITWLNHFVIAHGYAHGLVDVRLKRLDRDFFTSFQAAVGDLALGLLLFVYADVLGGDLDQAEPDHFQKRVAAVTEMISWI